MSIEYVALGEENYYSAIRILTGSFLSEEPLVRALGITRAELYPVMRQACKKALEDNLSVAAVNGEGVAT